MSRSRAVIQVATLGFVWVVLDQITKYLAVSRLTRLFPADAPLGERLELFYRVHDLRPIAGGVHDVLPFWRHVYVQNPAGAFGLLGGAPEAVRRWVFTGVAVVAVVGLLWMAARHAGPGHALRRLALGLVLGGAVGNLIDRVVHGYVIDFIDWYVGGWHWPAFNIADVGIVVGVFALLLLPVARPASEDAPPALPSRAPEA